MAAEIRAARAQLSDYKLIAPYDGVIAARHVDVGQWVDPGETVLELVAVDEVEILVDVRPELVAHVQVGGEATLHPAGGAGRDQGKQRTATAEVVGVVPSLDPATRTVRVRLRTSEARPWLLPGAPVDVGFPVRFEAGAREGGAQAVILPRDALVLGAVDIRVIEVVDGKAKPVQVELRASAGDRALVVGEGLEPGDAVVTRGNERLRPGQPVRILEPEQGAGAEGEEPAS
jgi:RND family efflux transporter MFP subunit